jgi:hypothetical protein
MRVFADAYSVGFPKYKYNYVPNNGRLFRNGKSSFAGMIVVSIYYESYLLSSTASRISK